MSNEDKEALGKKASAGRKRGNAPSSLEKKVHLVLDEIGVRWSSGRKISGFFPDLVIEDQMLIIEVNGCYWHACAICFPNHPDPHRMPKRDRMKIGAYRKAGYACSMLIEHEFDLDPLKTVLSALSKGGDFGS